MAHELDSGKVLGALLVFAVLGYFLVGWEMQRRNAKPPRQVLLNAMMDCKAVKGAIECRGAEVRVLLHDNGAITWK